MIESSTSRSVTPERFSGVLERSSLAERGPVDDPRTIELMLAHGELLVTAWDGSRLVGVARSVTDFAYRSHLSDLAVDRSCQGRGPGRELIARPRSRLERSAH